MKLSFYLFLSFLLLSSFPSTARKCTGSPNCKACTSCNYCKHCNRDGGSCGVCGEGDNDSKSSFYNKDIANQKRSNNWTLWVIVVVLCGFIFFRFIQNEK